MATNVLPYVIKSAEERDLQAQETYESLSAKLEDGTLSRQEFDVWARLLYRIKKGWLFLVQTIQENPLFSNIVSGPSNSYSSPAPGSLQDPPAAGAEPDYPNPPPEPGDNGVTEGPADYLQISKDPLLNRKKIALAVAAYFGQLKETRDVKLIVKLLWPFSEKDTETLGQQIRSLKAQPTSVVEEYLGPTAKTLLQDPTMQLNKLRNYASRNEKSIPEMWKNEYLPTLEELNSFFQNLTLEPAENSLPENLGETKNTLFNVYCFALLKTFHSKQERQAAEFLHRVRHLIIKKLFQIAEFEESESKTRPIVGEFMMLLKNLSDPSSRYLLLLLDRVLYRRVSYGTEDKWQFGQQPFIDLLAHVSSSASNEYVVKLRNDLNAGKTVRMPIGYHCTGGKPRVNPDVGPMTSAVGAGEPSKAGVQRMWQGAYPGAFFATGVPCIGYGDDVMGFDEGILWLAHVPETHKHPWAKNPISVSSQGYRWVGAGDTLDTVKNGKLFRLAVIGMKKETPEQVADRIEKLEFGWGIPLVGNKILFVLDKNELILIANILIKITGDAYPYHFDHPDVDQPDLQRSVASINFPQPPLLTRQSQMIACLLQGPAHLKGLVGAWFKYSFGENDRAGQIDGICRGDRYKLPGGYETEIYVACNGFQLPLTAVREESATAAEIEGSPSKTGRNGIQFSETSQLALNANFPTYRDAVQGSWIAVNGAMVLVTNILLHDGGETKLEYYNPDTGFYGNVVVGRVYRGGPTKFNLYTAQAKLAEYATTKMPQTQNARQDIYKDVPLRTLTRHEVREAPKESIGSYVRTELGICQIVNIVSGRYAEVLPVGLPNFETQVISFERIQDPAPCVKRQALEAGRENPPQFVGQIVRVKGEGNVYFLKKITGFCKGEPYMYNSNIVTDYIILEDGSVVKIDAISNGDATPKEIEEAFSRPTNMAYRKPVPPVISRTTVVEKWSELGRYHGALLRVLLQTEKVVLAKLVGFAEGPAYQYEGQSLTAYLTVVGLGQDSDIRETVVLNAISNQESSIVEASRAGLTPPPPVFVQRSAIETANIAALRGFIGQHVLRLITDKPGVPATLKGVQIDSNGVRVCVNGLGQECGITRQLPISEISDVQPRVSEIECIRKPPSLERPNAHQWISFEQVRDAVNAGAYQSLMDASVNVRMNGEPIWLAQVKGIVISEGKVQLEVTRLGEASTTATEVIDVSNVVNEHPWC